MVGKTTMPRQATAWYVACDQDGLLFPISNMMHSPSYQFPMTYMVGRPTFNIVDSMKGQLLNTILYYIQWNLVRETTPMSNYLSWKINIFRRLNVFLINKPLIKDHLPWETFFWPLGLVAHDKFHSSNDEKPPVLRGHFSVDLGVASQDRFHCTLEFSI